MALACPQRQAGRHACQDHRSVDRRPGCQHLPFLPRHPAIVDALGILRARGRNGLESSLWIGPYRKPYYILSSVGRDPAGLGTHDTERREGQ
jgi:hypothetical protein